MSLLPITNLETHETGTENVNAVINANWQKIEDMFASGVFAALVDGMTTITYGATITLDVEGSKRVNECNLTGNAIVAVSNKEAGRYRILLLEADGTPRTLTWPAGAAWVGSALTAVAASTIAAVMVICRGTVDADLVLINLAGGSGGGMNFVSVPASSTDTGTQGDVADDSANGYFYVCIATDTWIRMNTETLF